MGCGGSKPAKKDAASEVEESKPQPIKKVRTNFSDIHYDEPASARRDTVYAPSEIPESRRPTEVGEPSTIAEEPPVVGGDGMLSPGSTTPAAPDGAESNLERRKSWLERAMSMGKKKEISDEEMKKVIGMDRKELEQWSKDKPVGPRQEAQHAGDAVAGGDGG